MISSGSAPKACTPSGSDPFFSRFAPVSPQFPCPVCGKPDWCVIAHDGSAVLCQRVESPTRFGGAGWVHNFEMDPLPTVPPPKKVKSKLTPWELADLQDEYTSHAQRVDKLHALAEMLGLSFYWLFRLGVGWTGKAWSFPMRNATASLVGFRLRFPDGGKRAVPGSRNGLFMKTTYREMYDDWFVCEGPTDTIALGMLGLEAVGRPDCCGGVEYLSTFFEHALPQRIVIIADNDGPGMAGADALRTRLADEHGAPCVHVITPDQCKDVREYVNAGGTRQSIMESVTKRTSNEHWSYVV